MSTLKLIVIRYCETLENGSRIVQGPGRLSLRRQEQAMGIAKLLKHEWFEAVYSSDLKRVFKFSLRRKHQNFNMRS